MNKRNAIWFLIWAVMGLALLIGQYQQKLSREQDRLHAAVEESMIPPSTNYVRTR